VDVTKPKTGTISVIRSTSIFSGKSGKLEIALIVFGKVLKKVKN